jgi:hypothetical protein
MEVFTIISTNKNVKKLFFDFLQSNNTLVRSGKDIDKIYYQYKFDHRCRLYFYYEYLDFNDELRYNYDEADRKKIKNAFNTTELYAFDISYNCELIEGILEGFREYLKKKNIDFEILISHPFKGVISF